jgi:hypothetical protein
MSKLLKLQKWLSLVEASHRLSLVMKESANSRSVLRLALDGHLALSVHLVNGAYGRPCVPVKLEEIEWDEVPSLDSKRIVKTPKNGRILELGNSLYQIKENIVDLDSGVWDLPMSGGERIDVEFKYQQLNLSPVPTAVSLEGVLVQNPNGDIYEVQSRHEKSLTDKWKTKYFDPENFHPAGGLPEDSEFVVRAEALDAFLHSVNDETPNIERPLGTRERDTLLTIIAVLCQDAGYDYTKAAKTAGMIQGTATGMGVSIGETTIEGHLKKIPDALATRMK